jgi:hypothetical protein
MKRTESANGENNTRSHIIRGWDELLYYKMQSHPLYFAAYIPFKGKGHQESAAILACPALRYPRQTKIPIGELKTDPPLTQTPRRSISALAPLQADDLFDERIAYRSRKRRNGASGARLATQIKTSSNGKRQGLMTLPSFYRD